MTGELIYRSACSARNFWREYRVYDDRVELDTLIRTLTIPLSDVRGIEVAHSFADGLKLQLRGGLMGIKLDWADLFPHVVLDKSTGLFRHIAFTPDDPDAFRSALDGALARYRKMPDAMI
jgi:hypothetical protein